jgi:pilus assembly protein FimV
MAIDKNMVLKEAQKFAAKGQFDKAILEWRKLLKDYPSDSSIYNTIGDLSLKKGGSKGKAEAVDAYYRAGTILAAEGFTSKAIAVFRKVLNIDPKKVEVHLALGDMNADKGLTSNALESYKLAADHYKQNKEMRKALDIYQKMADLNPSNAAFRLKLADMYAKEGMNEAAIKSYLETADVHLSNGAFNDARQIFEKALTLDPNNMQVYYKAGIVYYKEGKYVEACKAIKPAFESDPANQELVDIYLDALAKAGRDTEAEEIYKKLLSQDETRIDLREKLFRLYLGRKEHDKALAEARIIAEARLKDRDVSGEKGNKLLPGTGEAVLDEGANAALDTLKGLVAENPDFVEGRRTLSDFYAKVGRGEDAARELVQASEILIGEGDKDGAKGALARAIELAPDMAEARQRLESLLPSPAAPEPAIAETAAQQLAPPQHAMMPPLMPATASSAPPAAEEDPAIAGAITEADVLVKYGLSAKALEQLEGLAKKFPQSIQVRTKLRDLYGDQGNVSKAVVHMLVLADLYAKRGARDQAQSILQTALELDPGNAEVRSQLGIAPSAHAQALAASGELTFEEPPGGTSPELGEEPVAPGFGARGEFTLDEPAKEAHAPGEFSFAESSTVPEIPAEEPLPSLEETTPAEFSQPAPEEPVEPPAPVSGWEASAPGEISFEELLTVPEIPAEEPLPSLEETTPAEFPQPVPEEPVERSARPALEMKAPEQKPPPKEPDLKEIWAEAEFYYQQGLLDEAKKHYAKIIQHDPSDTRAIERLTEISQEAKETREFSKFSETVDGLEEYAPASGATESGEVTAANESDEEAVRTLMQEMAQLKQQHLPVPSPGEDTVAPVPPKVASGEGVAASAPNDKAVRLLMQEIAQLKQQMQEIGQLKQKLQPVPSPSEDIVAPVPPKISGEGVAVSASDEEAVRTLMQEIAQLKQRTGALSGEATTAPPSPASPSKRKEQAVKQPDDFFDLASELRDELNSLAVPPPSSASAEAQGLDDMFEEFKKGVEQQAVKEDVDTHYNLGVAYKEMGLLDDAIAEFVLTPENEPKFVQSRYMLGLCYMDKGEHQKAIAEIQGALNFSENQGVALKDLVGLRYDLGLAYQLAGNAGGALNEFQKVYDADPGYRDTASKIKELQKGNFISLEQLKDDIEKEISVKFLEEGERIEREEKIRKNERVRS